MKLSNAIIERILAALGSGSMAALMVWQTSDDGKVIIIAAGLTFLTSMGIANGTHQVAKLSHKAKSEAS